MCACVCLRVCIYIYNRGAYMYSLDPLKPLVTDTGGED